MQNIEDARVLGVTSVSKPFGHGDSFRILNTLKPGRILETEVEMLGFRPSALPSDVWKEFCY